MTPLLRLAVTLTIATLPMAGQAETTSTDTMRVIRTSGDCLGVSCAGSERRVVVHRPGADAPAVQTGSSVIVTSGMPGTGRVAPSRKPAIDRIELYAVLGLDRLPERQQVVRPVQVTGRSAGTGPVFIAAGPPTDPSRDRRIMTLRDGYEITWPDYSNDGMPLGQALRSAQSSGRVGF